MADIVDFGWDILLKSADPKPQNEKDVLMLFMHWNLVKNKVLCLGVGDEKVLGEGEVGSELLPDKWNSNEKYSLRYIYKNELFLFFMVPSGDTLVVNLLKATDLKLSSCACSSDEVIALTGSLTDMFKDPKKLIHSVKVNLLDFIFDRKTATAFAQTETRVSATQGRSCFEGEDLYGRMGELINIPYGRGDLNPLAVMGRGGGNIFQIPGGRHENRPLPRHDPLHPFIHIDRRNADHLRMPGFEYDDIM